MRSFGRFFSNFSRGFFARGREFLRIHHASSFLTVRNLTWKNHIAPTERKVNKTINKCAIFTWNHQFLKFFKIKLRLTLKKIAVFKRKITSKTRIYFNTTDRRFRYFK
tara:strand:+ start:76228 stop:76551 length:324 start_codon:yes stop_codon:yes gene_type:complete